MCLFVSNYSPVCPIVGLITGAPADFQAAAAAETGEGFIPDGMIQQQTINGGWPTAATAANQAGCSIVLGTGGDAGARI